MAKKIIILWLFIASFVPSVLAQDGTIRVAIAQDAPSVYIRVKGRFEVRTGADNRLIYKGKNLKNQAVKVSRNKINFPRVNSNFLRLQIIPLKGSYVYVNKRAYRGKITLIVKGARLSAVNELNIEDYLRGVIPSEVAPWWPMDALKAQAIVARTYAFYQKQFTKDKDFDLTADVYSQVYGGKTSERWKTGRAVDLTGNRVLTFEGKVFPAYYHATCGGNTEKASMLWRIDIAPLKGVRCGFCADSPHFKWHARIPLAALKGRLIKEGFSVKDITGIEDAGRNASGRITELKIIGEKGVLMISAKDFRQALGPNILRSTNFYVTISGDAAYFEGFGWGHGVGLCQWGMYGMAKKGYKYEQILKYYFPQSELAVQ
jgi:stage II sporulation protein D